MNLLCCEAQVDFECRAYVDPAIVNHKKILRNLLSAEEKYSLTGSYFDCVQTELKPYMRKAVTEWMLEVCEEQQCQPDVYWLAVNYMDRFLSVAKISKGSLQLLGSVCLFLASKLKESTPLTADKLVLYTDNSITLAEIWQWELLVLSRLKWDLCAVTPHDFVDVLLSQLRFDKAPLIVDISNRWDATRRHAHLFIALCALEYKFTMYPPSMIACACVTIALRESCSNSSSSSQHHITCSSATISDQTLAQLLRLTQIENEWMRSCLEQVEEFLGKQLRTSAPEPQNNTDTSGGGSMISVSGVHVKDHEKAETPTDVRDIHF